VHEVVVPGCQRKVVLASQSRDPDIVLRNRRAFPGELSFYLPVDLGGEFIRKQKHRNAQKIADLVEGLLDARRSLGSIVKLA